MRIPGLSDFIGFVEESGQPSRVYVFLRVETVEGVDEFLFFEVSSDGCVGDGGEHVFEYGPGVVGYVGADGAGDDGWHLSEEEGDATA